MISVKIPAPAVTGQTTPFRNETVVVPTAQGPVQTVATSPAPGDVGGNTPVYMPAANPPLQTVPTGHGVIYMPHPQTAQTFSTAAPPGDVAGAPYPVKDPALT